MTLRSRLESGERTIGTFQLVDSPVAAEVVGLAGYDFTILDQEHGPFSAETTMQLCMAAQGRGASPIVRVRENAAPEIQRALDVGAAGVEIPQISTGADARAAVDAARYDPLGERGLSPYVRAADYAGGPEYTQRQNEEVTVVVHIEGTEGVENLEDVMAVEGIDVLFVGPYDLSQSLGIPGQVQDDAVVDMMEDVCARADSAGKVVGTFADSPEMARRWLDVGVQYLAYHVDATILHDAYVDVLDALDA